MKRPSASAVVGVAEQGSSVVLVTVARDGTILDRRSVDLVEPGLSTHPHHHEGSWAVGRYLNTPGAHRLPLADAVALVERVRACAGRRAGESFDTLAADVSVPIGAIAIRALPELPATIEGRIRDHRAQTQADSAMYREALAAAATARGWRVHWYDRERVMRDDLDDMLASMGRAIGPPWQARHKLAAAAALAATAHAPRR